MIKQIDSTSLDTSIIIGNILDDLHKFIKPDHILVVDENINRIYGDYFKDHQIITVNTSEAGKTLETAEYIYNKLFDLNAHRKSVITGIGGGVLTDIAGFVASTYMRGVEFNFVPTTLVAQTDAAIGGKNGLNFCGIKNIIGTVKQPKNIYIDRVFLETIPEKALASGFSEIIKTAMIGIPDLFYYLKEKAEFLQKLNEEFMNNILYETAKFKLEIVEKDQYDSDLRKILNFGHTFGHAIEAEYSPNYYFSHGEAVSIGMRIALHFSKDMGYIDNKLVDESLDLMNKFDLSVDFRVDCKRLLKRLKKDKKVKGDEIDYIILKDLGKAEIKSLPVSQLEDMCYAVPKYQ